MIAYRSIDSSCKKKIHRRFLYKVRPSGWSMHDVKELFFRYSYCLAYIQALMKIKYNNSLFFSLACSFIFSMKLFLSSFRKKFPVLSVIAYKMGFAALQIDSIARFFYSANQGRRRRIYIHYHRSGKHGAYIANRLEQFRVAKSRAIIGTFEKT